jgi:hypothetical protein
MLPSPMKPTLSGTPHLSEIRCNPPRSDPVARMIRVETNYHGLLPPTPPETVARKIVFLWSCALSSLTVGGQSKYEPPFTSRISPVT